MYKYKKYSREYILILLNGLKYNLIQNPNLEKYKIKFSFDHLCFV